MDEIFDALREELEDEVPELETEFVPLVQDQINDLAGVEQPDRGQGLRARSRQAPRARRPRSARSSRRSTGAVDVNTHVLLGNPDIVVRPDSVQTARVGLTEMDVESQLNAALYGQVASTVPEQDRMTKIRVRYPDRVRFDRDHLGQLPISLATATPAAAPRPAHARRRGHRLRPARPARLDPGRPQPQRALAREPAAGHHRHRRAGQAATSARSTASFKRKLAELKFPPGYRWELAGNYRAQQESFASLLTVLIVAAALVFLLLGFQFHEPDAADADLPGAADLAGQRACSRSGSRARR